MGLFTKFVEVGRVVYIKQGNGRGHIAAIVNVIDARRLLVAGPKVHRQAVHLNNVQLTRFTVSVHLNAKHGTVSKVFEKNKIQEQFSKTGLAKKIAIRKARQSMTDFDRFRVKLAKQARSKAVKAVLKKAAFEHRKSVSTRKTKLKSKLDKKGKDAKKGKDTKKDAKDTKKDAKDTKKDTTKTVKKADAKKDAKAPAAKKEAPAPRKAPKRAALKRPFTKKGTKGKAAPAADAGAKKAKVAAAAPAKK